MSKFLHEFSKWKPLTNIDDVPNSQIIYVIRVVDVHKVPIHINRARAKDYNGILNIGSGKGRDRLKKMQYSFASLNSTNEWNSKHHQLVLWCLKFDFATLLGLNNINLQNIEYCWANALNNKAARKKEKETILHYKDDFADIPIGNLKSW